MNTDKPIHSLVLDAGPIIKNEPAVSTLLKQAEQLFTVPSIISEIKDANTRSRVQTTLQPFLTVRSPAPKSVKHIADFARKTGDLSVLSRPDLEIIALTYELECERNQGDWRLRNVPGQKRLNGAPPAKNDAEETQVSDSTLAAVEPTQIDSSVAITAHALEQDTSTQEPSATNPDGLVLGSSHDSGRQLDDESSEKPNSEVADQASSLQELRLADEILADDAHGAVNDEEDASTSDSDGWITPSNLKQQQAKDLDATTDDTVEPAIMQAAVITSDFAMQNVLLQMNINLLSSSLQRVKHLKTFILRCHACFLTTKDMSKQFCPRCGQPALTRVACSTNAKGEFKLHLKKQMQWNTRGDRYSIPKPQHGSANNRVQGGGRGGWGHDLILAEDQKEYERARVVERKQKERSLMDEDYLPSILTGDRSRGSGRIKVGAGKNVNARKR